MLKPKITTPDFAIRLTGDVIGEAGQWLLVFDKTVKVMSHEEVMDRYDDLEANPPPQPAPAALLLPPPNDPVDRKMLQVLLALKKTGGKDKRSGELRRYLDAPQHAQISAKLASCFKAGLVVRRVSDEGDGRGYLWSLTEAGWNRLASID